MHVLLISTLPDIHEFFGMQHHYPVGVLRPRGGGTLPAIAPVSDPEGVTTFAAFDPERAGSIAEVLRADDAAGPVVAHLSGTSAAMRRVADELRSRSVPYLYSPMLPSIPSRFAAIAGRFRPDRHGAMAGPGLAAPIAASAASVIVDSVRLEEYFRRRAGIADGRIITLPAPTVADVILAGRAPGFGNLALAFCDAMTPEWNVMRFLFAMEKINADAVLVAGGGDGPGARECAVRAALNARVKIFRYGPDRPSSLPAEIAGFVSRATIVVDPSVHGLGGVIVGALAGRGIPGVISRNSVRFQPTSPGVFSFEPSSWELLNHAITSAFNAAAAGGPDPAGMGAEDRDAELARTLRRLYRRAAGMEKETGIGV